MYTNLNLFLRAEYFAFCKTRFSLRRWTYVIFFTILYWLMWIVIGFGRLLDRLLFRSFLYQEVREPVFIIAPPRSGTTFLQKLMALDEERFVMPSFTRPFSHQFSTSGVSPALLASTAAPAKCWHS